MQYLIKRRKSMTPAPSLYHPTLDKLGKTSSTLLSKTSSPLLY